MPKHGRSATSPLKKVGSGGAKSGLTTAPVRPTPVLFGSKKLQDLLLKIARDGEVRLTSRPKSYHERLAKIGICTIRRDADMDVIKLDASYPAAKEIRAVLSDITGTTVRSGKHGNGTVHQVTPLGHPRFLPFRLMLVIAQSVDGLDDETIRRRIPDVWPLSVTKGIKVLVRDGVLEEGGGQRFTFAADVPISFKPLLFRLAEFIDDSCLAESEAAGPRPSAFRSAADNAPRLFGTDIRLRNLMALAVYGPMLYRDLRRITGAGHLREEDWGDAPFGRAALMRTWKTLDGTALALDTKHPLHPPLYRLLIRLSEIYPLSPHVPAFDKPKLPRSQAWIGDKDALFGGPIPTRILMSIGVLGWTFEALCCASIDHDRWNIKKSMRRLEEEGVLQGDRPRKPGMNVRIVRIADAFPARD